MRLLSIVVSLVAQSCLAWFLAPDGRGAYGVCMAFAGMLAVVFSFGTDRAMQFYVISKRLTISEGAVLAVILAFLGSTSAAVVGWFLIDSPFEFFQKASPESFRFSLLLIPSVMLTTSLQLLLIARRRFLAAGATAPLSALLNALLVILLVGFAEMDVRGALVAIMLAEFAAVVFGLVILWRYDDCRPVRIRASAFRITFSYGARYYLARLGVVINTHLPLVLLASYAAPKEIGWFIAAWALMNRTELIPRSLVQAIQPRVGESSDGRPELVAQAARVLLVFMGLGLLIMVAPSWLYVPIIFSPAFAPSVPILWILALGALVRSVTRPMASYFIGVDRPGVTSLCTTVQLLTIGVGVPWFYEVGGIQGAAWAVVAGQVLEGFCLEVAFRVVSRQTFGQTWLPRSSDILLVRNSFWGLLGRSTIQREFDSLEQADAHRDRLDTRQIILLEDRVIKRQSPDPARIELEKSKQGESIGRQCGWFCVPRVLDANIDTGTIQFERLHHVVPLWTVLRRGGDTSQLLTNAGRSLAAIHNNLELPDDMSSKMSSVWVGGSDWPMTCLHGDFNTENLLVDSRTGQLHIIDWSMNDFSRASLATIGPCYFDLSWFVFSLSRQGYFGLNRIRGIDDKVDAFLLGYFQESRHPCSLDGLRNYLCHVFSPAVHSLPLKKPLWERTLRFRTLHISYSAFDRIVRSLVARA